MRLRRFIFGAAAMALLTGTVLAAGAASASASVRNQPVIQANGTASCGNASLGKSGIKGTITFTPALKLSPPYVTENTTIKIKLKKCTTTATNLPPGGTLKGKVSQSISSPTSTNDCANLAMSTPQTLTVKWTYNNSSGVSLATLNPTVTSFSGYNVATEASPWPAADAGDTGFSLPGGSPPVTASDTATSSFDGTDNGASSASVAFLNLTTSGVATACSSSTGLKSANFILGASFSG